MMMVIMMDNLLWDVMIWTAKRMMERNMRVKKVWIRKRAMSRINISMTKRTLGIYLLTM
jgi:hypothetical protein